MKLLTLGALILTLLKSTTQKCHDELFAESNCENRYDYRVGNHIYQCTKYYGVHCYMIDRLESMHQDYVEQISVYSSNLSELTSEFFNDFKNVELITMSGNNIPKVSSETFLYLVKLTSLKLANNNISAISKGSFKAVKMITLDLSNNNISVIEKDSFNNVNTLALSYNKLVDISNLMESCNTLQTLDISYNNINTIIFLESCSSLWNLDISHNQVVSFRINSTQPLQLGTLNLSYNSIADLSSNDLENLDNLTKLDLSSNPLFHDSNLPVDLFQNTQKLQFLNLSSTKVQTIFIGTFGKLSNLEILDLSSNNLTELTKGIFYDLDNLHELYLHNNHLTQFESNGLAKLNRINLNANLWTCNTLADTVYSLKRNKVVIVHGPTNHISNILGIYCSNTPEDGKQIPFQSSDTNLNHLQKEYESFYNNMQQDLQKAFLQQENRSHMLITDQLNLSNIYWNKINQDHQSFAQKIQQTIQDIMYKISNFFTSTETALQNTTIDEMRVRNNSLNRWRLFQQNFSEAISRDQSNFEEMQQKFQDALTNMQESFHAMVEYFKSNNVSPRTLTNQTEVFSSNALKFSSSNEQPVATQSYKALVVGVYGILIILVLGLIYVLVIRFTRFKNIQIQHEECSSLNTLQV